MKIQAIHNLLGILKHSLRDFKQIQDKSHPVESSPLPNWPEKMERFKNFDTSFSQPVGMLGVLLQPPPLELTPPTLPEVRKKMTSLKKKSLDTSWFTGKKQGQTWRAPTCRQRAAHRHHISPGLRPGNPPLGVERSLPWPLVYSKKPWVTWKNIYFRRCLLALRTHLCTDRVTSMVPVVLPATMFTSKDTRKRRIYSFYNKVHIIKRSKRN